MAGVYNASAKGNDEKLGKVNNAKLPDTQTLKMAGIDPKTGLPIRMGYGLGSATKDSIKKALRIIDEQDAVNRYKWYNLPCNLTSQELERLLYYKGQLAFFPIKDTQEFYFMPYALDGGIDFYGRFNRIHPVPMANGTTEEEKKQYSRQRSYLYNLKLNVIYDVYLDEITPDIFNNSCVLLHDYTKQLSQTVIPRQELQEGVIDIMSDCIPFMRTALLNSTGVQGMRVNGEDEQSNVTAASALINQAALRGEKYIAITGATDFQDLTGGSTAKSEEFLLAMQSLDNFRLSTYGIDNGGIFEKKAHKLESEQQMNRGNVGLVYEDGLAIRQHFCNVCNSIWGLGMWCEASETVLGLDTSGDGLPLDEQEQSGTLAGETPEEVVVENE